MEIKKICRTCNEEKLLIDFSKKIRNKDGLQSECRICQNTRGKMHYKKDPERSKKIINAAKKIRVDINRQKLFVIKSTTPCVDCGVTDYRILDFDHKDDSGKICGVGELVTDGYSWIEIEKEIAKCEGRCANCHRIKTSNQQNWYKHNKSNFV